MKTILRFILISVLTTAAATGPLSAQTHVFTVADPDSADSRPLLKRLFHDFPTLFTDTAYNDSSYRLLFRATLLNNNWHRHHSETKVTPAGNTKGDSVTGKGKRKPPMVIFIRRRR